ncbi:unnamed protein product, partial [Hydatigera taeniaeformis]|uniref:RRM domain-containing protein n=1 Tax=Hydatigena taeniaeformis TaxID=6205 RepID=A0A0R3WX27_HYDTA
VEAGGKADDEINSKSNASKPKQAVTCRTCKGAHFSLQCPFRSEMEALRSFMDSANAAAVQEIAPELNTGRYIPPALRAAAAATNSVPERRRMDGFSIRVTNLPENTSESDLREIFSRFGDVIRIFPAKDKRTQLNRVGTRWKERGLVFFKLTDIGLSGRVL